MDKEDGAHDDIGHAVMRQALDLWISPEVARRQALDRIPTPFTLRAGQVLISPREGQPIVRLNEEVKGVVRATTTRAIDAGEAVTRSDIGEMSDFELIEDELDYGHITLLEHDGVWLVTFSFLYNRSKSREFHRAALDFLMAARISSEHGLVRPVVENLLHAVENAAKARLLETPEIHSTQGRFRAGTPMNTFVPRSPSTSVQPTPRTEPLDS